MNRPLRELEAAFLRGGSAVRSALRLVVPAPAGTLRLADGRNVSVRPLAPDDGDAVQTLVRELSPATRRNRFFAGISELSPAQLECMTRFDPPHALVFGAEAGTPARLVGIAQYAVCEPGVAEFALVVTDAWQGIGLGHELLAGLLDRARSAGLERIEGFVLAGNRPMLHLAERLGFSTRASGDPYLVRVQKALRGSGSDAPPRAVRQLRARQGPAAVTPPGQTDPQIGPDTLRQVGGAARQDHEANSH